MTGGNLQANRGYVLTQIFSISFCAIFMSEARFMNNSRDQYHITIFSLKLPTLPEIVL